MPRPSYGGIPGWEASSHRAIIAQQAVIHEAKSGRPVRSGPRSSREKGELQGEEDIMGVDPKSHGTRRRTSGEQMQEETSAR
mgnify:CR=1 FL=1